VSKIARAKKAGGVAQLVECLPSKNEALRLDFDHMRKGGMRIGKTPKKLYSICCPQCRETNADTLKRQRPIGEGNQELGPSYYCLYSLFNKIRDKGKIVSAW
jgi:hypothetical protein